VAFELSFAGVKPRQILDDSLPPRFEEIAHTRRLVTTTLRSVTFEEKATFWLFNVKTLAKLQDQCLRRVGTNVRHITVEADRRVSSLRQIEIS
jgi:hypothetical protein